MEVILPAVVWKYAFRIIGGQFVMTSGMKMMLVLSVDSWGFHVTVRYQVLVLHAAPHIGSGQMPDYLLHNLEEYTFMCIPYEVGAVLGG